MKRSLALTLAVSFFAQSTGAADFAAAFGAARPGHLAFPHPSVAAMKAPAAKAAAAKPAGPSLLARYAADLRVVTGWTRERLSALDAALRLYRTPAELATALVPAPAAPAAAPAELPSVTEAPGSALDAAAAAFERPVDRIMILRDSLIVGAASALSSRLSLERAPSAPTHPRVEGVWQQGDGFRFRVNYLDAYGTTRGVANGFYIDSEYAAKPFVETEKTVPETLRRLAPIYFRGMRMRYEVELEAGESPVRGAKVYGRQEELDGRQLTAIELLGTVDLEPGRRVTLKSPEVLLRGQGQEIVNFEQTHLLVTGEGGKILADEKAAGIVDPPGD